MNWDQVAGEWKDIKGQVKSKWGKLTDDDVTTIGGKKDSFIGKLQERYGMIKEDAEKAVDEFIAGFNKDKKDEKKYDAPASRN